MPWAVDQFEQLAPVQSFTNPKLLKVVGLNSYSASTRSTVLWTGARTCELIRIPTNAHKTKTCRPLKWFAAVTISTTVELLASEIIGLIALIPSGKFVPFVKPVHGRRCSGPVVIRSAFFMVSRASSGGSCVGHLIKAETATSAWMNVSGLTIGRASRQSKNRASVTMVKRTEGRNRSLRFNLAFPAQGELLSEQTNSPQ